MSSIKRIWYWFLDRTIVCHTLFTSWPNSGLPPLFPENGGLTHKKKSLSSNKAKICQKNIINKTGSKKVDVF